MICDICKIDKLITDFINSENICYKCLYRIKIAKMSKKRTEPIANCRCCGEPIIRKKNERKRQRTVFCSVECAEKGHKDQLKNHWTKTLGQIPGISGGKSIKFRSNAQNRGINL